MRYLLLAVLLTGCFPQYRGDIKPLPWASADSSLKPLGDLCVTKLNEARKVGHRARKQEALKLTFFGAEAAFAPTVSKITSEKTRTDVTLGMVIVGALASHFWTIDEEGKAREKASVAIWDEVQTKFAASVASNNSKLVETELLKCVGTTNTGLGL